MTASTNRISIGILLCLLLIGPDAFAVETEFLARLTYVVTASACPDVAVGDGSSNIPASVRIDPDRKILWDNQGRQHAYKAVSNLPTGVFLGTVSLPNPNSGILTSSGWIATTNSPEVTLATTYDRFSQGCIVSNLVTYYFNEPPPFGLDTEDVTLIKSITKWIKGYVESSPKNKNSKPKSRNACMCVRG